jgi:hypothetical protein
MEFLGEVTVTVLGLDQSRYQAEIDAGLREREEMRHAALVDRQRRQLQEEERRKKATAAGGGASDGAGAGDGGGGVGEEENAV